MRKTGGEAGDLVSPTQIIVQCSASDVERDAG